MKAQLSNFLEKAFYLEIYNAPRQGHCGPADNYMPEGKELLF